MTPQAGDQGDQGPLCPACQLGRVAACLPPAGTHPLAGLRDGPLIGAWGKPLWPCRRVQPLRLKAIKNSRVWGGAPRPCSWTHCFIPPPGLDSPPPIAYTRSKARQQPNRLPGLSFYNIGLPAIPCHPLGSRKGNKYAVSWDRLRHLCL